VNILISPLLATSIVNQANLVKKLIEEKGYGCWFRTTISVYDIRDKNTYAILWFTLATVSFVNEAVFPYLYCRDTAKKPCAVYVTVEGVPTRANLLCSNLGALEYVANSQFTAKALRQAGYNVVDVVHHAVDTQQCRRNLKVADKIKRAYDDRYKDRCRLLYVGRNDPRKALDRLAEAVKILNDKGVKDFVLMLVTDDSAKTIFNMDNCEFVAPFGSLSYDKILQLYAIAHFTVFPTRCEGFGLPLLESNAMGTPVVHAWFEPLSEFSSQDFNFTFDFEEEKFVDCGRVQYWWFHDYPAEWLAETMEMALDVWRSKPKKYQEYREEALRHASKWDYKNVYAKLLKRIGVK